MRTAEAREVHIGKVVGNAVLFNFGGRSQAGEGGAVLLKLYDLTSLRKIVGEIQERIERFDRR